MVRKGSRKQILGLLAKDFRPLKVLQRRASVTSLPLLWSYHWISSALSKWRISSILQKTLSFTTFKHRGEGWQSGRMRRSWKPLNQKWFRGFESLSFRHLNNYKTVFPNFGDQTKEIRAQRLSINQGKAWCPASAFFRKPAFSDRVTADSLSPKKYMYLLCESASCSFAPWLTISRTGIVLWKW